MSALSEFEVPKNTTHNNLWSHKDASTSSYPFSSCCGAVYEPVAGPQASGYNFDGFGLEIWVNKKTPTEDIETPFGKTKTEQVVCGDHTLTFRMLIKHVD